MCLPINEVCIPSIFRVISLLLPFLFHNCDWIFASCASFSCCLIFQAENFPKFVIYLVLKFKTFIFFKARFHLSHFWLWNFLSLVFIFSQSVRYLFPWKLDSILLSIHQLLKSCILLKIHPDWGHLKLVSVVYFMFLLNWFGLQCRRSSLVLNQKNAVCFSNLWRVVLELHYLGLNTCSQLSPFIRHALDLISI